MEVRRKRVLVVDDHPIIRDGLASLLSMNDGFCVCGEATNIASAMQAIRELAPDVALIDIALGRESGLDLIDLVRVERPELPMLVLSMYDESMYAKRVLQAGARGYIMKQAATDSLIDALEKVIAGEIYVSDQVGASLLRTFSNGGSSAKATDGPLSKLTDRELQIYLLLGRGVGTRAIAEQLHVSAKTIESHRARIKQKLGLTTALELVVHAAQQLQRGD
jgi:DNA-binding NarL/FixJ family response regulator